MLFKNQATGENILATPTFILFLSMTALPNFTCLPREIKPDFCFHGNFI